jgi:SOS-response transcriptional repressor LexA
VEVRSSPFVLRFKGTSRVDPQTDGGDDGIVRAQPWVGHGAVGEAGVDVEVTVKMSLHWRTGLWLTPEAQQQGSPLLKLRSQLRIYIVS